MWFHSIATATAEFHKTTYLKSFSSEERDYRLKTQTQNQTQTGDSYSNLLNAYIKQLRDFTQDEHIALESYFNHILQRAPCLQSIKFGLIKIDSNPAELDWNFPYTINQSIVLPTGLLNTMCDAYVQLNRIPSFLRPQNADFDQHMVTLTHELIHIIQRNSGLYPEWNSLLTEMFQRIWGFRSLRNVTIEGLAPHMPFMVTNPDGANFQWAIQIPSPSDPKNSRWYLPILTHDVVPHSNGLPTGILVEIQWMNSNRLKLIGGKWHVINQFPMYTSKFFGLTHQLYHPNEISAHLISEFLIKNQEYHPRQDQASANGDSFKFYTWLRQHIINK
jgi:hypothetical protein